MFPDFLLNLLASFAYDLLTALGRRLAGQGDLQRELSDALRQNAEASQALQAVLSRLGAPRVVLIRGDVSGSVIVLGDFPGTMLSRFPCPQGGDSRRRFRRPGPARLAMEGGVTPT